jgi:hypothetical protein
MTISESNLSSLARSYNTLANKACLKQIILGFIDTSLINFLTKPELHKEINNILTLAYKGESRLKAKLVEMFIGKNVTAAFEMRVNTSRVDFLAINGDTKSFEIKSNLDNLTKLEKQVSDYEKVFEYNYIVIDECHLYNALDLIPIHYGVYLMENEKLIRKKIAQRNCTIEPLSQLRLFTKKELLQNFKDVETDVNKILQQFSKEEINDCFKRMLKKRYDRKWNFLKENISHIFPIDYQFFFHHNIQPTIIYNV